MFFADCAVIPEPTVDQLADIAVETGITCRTLTGMKPRIAMLSFTTHSNGRLPGPAKVAAATAAAEAAKKAADEAAAKVPAVVTPPTNPNATPTGANA
jgi:phosphate acetyltransferase